MTGHHEEGFARARLIATVAVAALVLGIAGYSYSHSTPSGRLMVVAEFSDASPLLVGNDVRTAGVKVGTITSIAVQGRVADVGIELDSTALPVYQNASMKIRPVSLLGEQYVDLDRGTPGHSELVDGAHLATHQTSASVGLDQVLNSLDQPTSAGLGLLVNALGTGLDKNGKNAQDAIKALAPALSQTSELTTVLAQQNQVLGQLVQNLAPVTGALATNDGKAMDQLVAASQNILATTAERDAALRQLLDQLPATLSTAQHTLGGLATTAKATTPMLAALRPTTSQLPAMSRELSTFADAANPALQSATPLLREADKLLRAARPDVASLRQTGPSLLSAARSAGPITSEVAPHINDILNFLKLWALTTNGADGFGHYFRAGLILSGDPALGNLPAATATGTKQGNTSGIGGLNVGGLLGGITKPLQGLLSPVTGSGGGVTGLTSGQESGLLGSLLGGK